MAGVDENQKPWSANRDLKKKKKKVAVFGGVEFR